VGGQVTKVCADWLMAYCLTHTFEIYLSISFS